jgi:hypothetical protein
LQEEQFGEISNDPTVRKSNREEVVHSNQEFRDCKISLNIRIENQSPFFSIIHISAFEILPSKQVNLGGKHSLRIESKRDLVNKLNVDGRSSGLYVKHDRMKFNHFRSGDDSAKIPSLG